MINEIKMPKVKMPRYCDYEEHLIEILCEEKCSVCGQTPSNCLFALNQE